MTGNAMHELNYVTLVRKWPLPFLNVIEASKELTGSRLFRRAISLFSYYSRSAFARLLSEIEPSFPYRDVTVRRGVEFKDDYDIQAELGR